MDRLGRSVCSLILSRAGVELDGGRPWDIRVKDERLFRRVLVEGSLGLGDAYVEGWWETDDLEGLACRLAAARLERVTEWLPWGVAHTLAAVTRNAQTRGRATRVAREHYDFGNDLFAAFLGRIMNYSCGYFRGTEDLEEAQLQKLDLICQKLDLRPGDRLLDVGGGWGELARHAAARYGARVTSINISEEQMRFARERCRGLDVEVVRCDYRDVRGSFDKIAAVAMFTHVGASNYRTFMRSMRRVLVPEGALLIEGVWGNVSTRRIDAWIDRNVFPGATIPSGAQTFGAFEGIFVAEDVHNFGPDYLKTLRAWNARLGENWPSLQARYGERVRKTFEFFFLLIAGFFRARALQHWHLVLTPTGAAQPAWCRLTDVRAVAETEVVSIGVPAPVASVAE
jgi:cyclopropane-fatty-acyl-phospholipid synthase